LGASDYMVGNAPAGASYSAPLVGFQLGQSIADLPDAYMKGREQARQRAMEDAFKDGPPRDPATGQLDTNAIINKGMQIGGLPFAQPLLQYMLDLEAGKAWSGAIPSEQGQTGPAPPNSAAGPGNLGAGAQPARPAMRPQGAPQRASAGADNEGAENIRSLITGLAGGREVGSAIRDAVQKFRIGPDADLSPEQVKAVTAFVGPKLRGGAPSEVNQPAEATSAADDGINGGSRPPFMGGGTSGAPAPAGGRAPNAVAQAGPGMAAVDNAGAGGAPSIRQTPVGTADDARVAFTRATNMRKAALAMPSTNPGRQKALLDQAQAEQTRGENILKSLGEYNKPTGEQINARDEAVQAAERAKLTNQQKNTPPGMSVPEGQAYAEALKGQAAASVKNIAARIEGIKPAQDSIQVLDEMMNAFRSGGTNISTGPGAQQWLKVKQAVNNQIPGFFKGVPEAEEVDKLNSYLASAVAKAMTPRPTQYEFKAFQQQTPGLLTSREGSAVLADILRQTKVQELELGRIADKFKFGGKSWSDVEEKYFKDHPIISPQTHKPIDAQKAPDGKWYRPDPDRPGKYIVER
jgi:hypothetical protein